MAELMLRAQKHMNAEDAMSARKESNGGSNSRPDKKRSNSSSKEEREAKTSWGSSQSRARIEDKREGYRELDRTFSPLTTKLKDVLMEIRDDPALRWPERHRTPSNQRNKNWYCRFHRDHGHDTEYCIDLKQQVEKLIQ